MENSVDENQVVRSYGTKTSIHYLDLFRTRFRVLGSLRVKKISIKKIMSRNKKVKFFNDNLSGLLIQNNPLNTLLLDYLPLLSFLARHYGFFWQK